MKSPYFIFIFLLASIQALAQVNGYKTIDTLITMRDGTRVNGK
ncbi:hypothetical protein EDD80_1251 [Anseongella ginsenosidimutans]|uniref:Uncharacterized protein n=1 Tax=Anseongella ginsenosidimutans TaxID=496056 RepID=A0A4R3KKE0_9SPHI|nr:hypothetical protein [Anseongella ginsenosidimutans]TCS83910.1 hypothetical protein EDD80_1251 [Anseongella ginsenosidimutans]